MEENTNITTQASTSQETNAPEVKTPFKAYATEDEYKRELQSVSSKAKGEILKEIGVDKIDDIKTQIADWKSKHGEAETRAKDLEGQLSAANAANEQVVVDYTLKSLNVNPELKAEFLTLASTAEGKTFEEKAQNVINKLPQFRAEIKNNVVIGIDRKTAPMKSPGALRIDEIRR